MKQRSDLRVMTLKRNGIGSNLFNTLGGGGIRIYFLQSCLLPWLERLSCALIRLSLIPRGKQNHLKQNGNVAMKLFDSS